MASISIECPVCEKPISLDVTITPGERAITGGPPDNWHPGSGLEVELNDKIPQKCPHCNAHFLIEEILVIETAVEKALDNFDFDTAMQEDEHYPEPEDAE